MDFIASCASVYSFVSTILICAGISYFQKSLSFHHCGKIAQHYRTFFESNQLFPQKRCHIFSKDWCRDHTLGLEGLASVILHCAPKATSWLRIGWLAFSRPCINWSFIALLTLVRVAEHLRYCLKNFYWSVRWNVRWKMQNDLTTLNPTTNSRTKRPFSNQRR